MSRLINHLTHYLEPRDDTAYHMCTLPNHYHYIPLRFKTCNDPGAWTWESRYSE